MIKSAIATAFIIASISVSFANDIVRLSKQHNFVRIHETVSDESIIIKRENIESIVVRRDDQDWRVYITTTEIGPIFGGGASNRIYRYEFLTQSKAEDFARKILEILKEDEEKH